MADNIMEVVIQLRKDILSAYEATQNTFIPADGEVCLVELATGEIKMKIGDGTSTFAQLDYADKFTQQKIESVNVRGYYYNGEFYVNKTYTEKYVPYTYKLYIDNDTREIYSYNGTNYEICSMVEYATPEKAGVAKLYDSLGNAKDGSITQDCATKNFNKKVEMELEEETLILTDNFN